jgi:hypothetical protein
MLRVRRAQRRKLMFYSSLQFFKWDTWIMFTNTGDCILQLAILQMMHTPAYY